MHHTGRAFAAMQKVSIKKMSFSRNGLQVDPERLAKETKIFQIL
jgi:hypothetical protein